MDISIVIPCYNEEKRIRAALFEIDKFLKTNKKINNYEIICIDDGSNDKTRNIIKDVQKRIKNILLNPRRKNIGKGYSVKEGIFMAKRPYILFTDTDLSTPISEVNKFFPYLRENGIIIASRNLEESKVERKLLRQIIGKGFTLLSNFILGLDYKDTQCGFKLFKRKAAQKVFSLQKVRGFAFDVEMLLIANKKGYKTLEVPVTWTDSKESKLKPIKESLRMFKDILFIKINNLLGKY